MLLLLTGPVLATLSCTACMCNILLIYRSLLDPLVAVCMVRHERVLTPEGHEDGEEDSGWVVKQVASSGCTTRCHQLPVAAGTVTQRTHGDVVPGITNLHTDNTGMDGRDELFKR